MSDSVPDKAYDEVIAIETDSDDVSTPASSEASSPNASPKAKAQRGNDSPKSPSAPGAGRPQKGGGDDSDASGDSSSDASTSDSDEHSTKSSRANAAGQKEPGGVYNPEEWRGLEVSEDIEELFELITRYTPHTIELETVLKPCIPELVPAIGEVDAFLKMPRPDAKEQILGTERLDEPTLDPSDPGILDLQLRSHDKRQDLQPAEVRSIENAAKSPKEIGNWVRRIEELIRSKPAPSVQYSKRMPDIEQLMQVWPPEFEDYVQESGLPELSELDLDLADLVRIIASILDVPTHSQLTETLHVIFTLYSEFNLNQHFAKKDTEAYDPYDFRPQPVLGAHTQALFGQVIESMAPSRAPSPAERTR